MKLIKTIILSCLILLSISCAKLEKVSETNVNIKSKEKAEKLASSIMEGMKNKKYYKLTKEDANDAMLNRFGSLLQEKSYEMAVNKFGEYKSLEYSETLKKGKFTVYKFKGKFGDNNPVEVRIVFDENDKLAGFFNIPWEG